MERRRIVIIVLCCVAFGLVVAGLWLAVSAFSEPRVEDRNIEQPRITSFGDCVAAGYPVMESYPRQCREPGGVLFIESVVPVEPSDTTVAESWGSIYGNVLLGPVCPVERDPPDPDCADRPYETRLALTTGDGARVIREFSSSAEGEFNIDVPAGTYAIRSAAGANILPRCASREAVRVPVNGSARADVFCDSGIR